MENTKLLIKTENLSIGYANTPRQKRIVSSQLNLSAERGKLVVLMGPNGCGKSTLMRTLVGLQPAIAGYVYLHGQRIERLKTNEKARLVSLVLTDHISAAHLTVFDIVSIGRYPYIGFRGKLAANDHAIIQQCIRKCMLQGYEHRLYAEISDGEKQRTMIARALAQDSPIILLDEPTAHLDLPGRIEIMQMLSHLTASSNKCILLSSHDLDTALQWADIIWLMDRDGKICTGIPEDLVLQHHFPNVFGNERLHFDIEEGRFVLPRPMRYSVNLHGEGIKKKWTLKALKRNGYYPTDIDSTVGIEVKDNGWILRLEKTQARYQSIEETIDAMEKLMISKKQDGGI